MRKRKNAGVKNACTHIGIRTKSAFARAFQYQCTDRSLVRNEASAAGHEVVALGNLNDIMKHHIVINIALYTEDNISTPK